jgi:hypothetical protein
LPVGGESGASGRREPADVQGEHGGARARRGLQNWGEFCVGSCGAVGGWTFVDSVSGVRRIFLDMQLFATADDPDGN